ncbi:phosphate ABC transporter permease PstA [Arthrobacter sp. TES]|uniref:Phosphate transport system permease protein PstA n=1 Tax=Paenarthrobacter ureafaciens TaxID=37931 RepID=A0AAX3EIA4_PAEUR|nr:MULTISPECIES: phosphate ABC transporter permease PstA [Paenarthrobacter]AMB38941.1 phosphate ABC transporter permease [Arthrobacter sp. ATCC 21022]AOY73215.1 phosphate ABC transporter permease [Arthrobacter sp. ZXY-2]ERI38969.1 phosphate ABC transporter permease [Arthrobacter sp. AK-YN10]NKR13021.1 phosphate ABC transporter, permease protein PstA [Arthrobacter sp. M5]NKR16772.1 phosphate ABC transporter, permease protein PstA [Arthrobacter sp. M6]OEH59839.1 phosphate ABC transporter, perme
MTATAVRKRSALTRGQLPKFAPYVVLAVALIVGAAILALIGFNAFGWGLVSAILFTVGLVAWSGVVEGARKAKDKLATCLVVGAFLVALLPLVSVIWTVLVNGIPGLVTPGFLSTSMNGVTGAYDNKAVEEGGAVFGGIYHALLGTVQITLLATVISVPVGLLTAIYLVEYGADRPLAKAITFFVDVMTGIPSIVAGLFAAAFFFAVVGPGTKTGAVAAVALSVLMIPVVVRSSEEMLKIVPNELREASYALGVRKWRTILKVVIPTAISGIASGVTLAIARVIGETAPILVTAGFATTINNNVFGGWMASLPTFIYTQILNPTSPSNPGPSDQRAWGAALVLIILVMLLNLGARLIARLFAPKTGR